MKQIIDKTIKILSGLTEKDKKVNTSLSNIILTQSELIAVSGKLDNILNLFNTNKVVIKFKKSAGSAGACLCDIHVNGIRLGHLNEYSDAYVVDGTTHQSYQANYPLNITAWCTLPTNKDYLQILDKDNNILSKQLGGNYQITLQNGPSEIWIQFACYD